MRMECYAIADIDAAFKVFEENIEPRRAVRDGIYKTYSTIDVFVPGDGSARAPFESMYVELPLLREVKREKLPDIRDRRRGDGPEDDRTGRDPRESDLRRYEEAMLQQESVTYEPRNIADLLSSAGSAGPRIIVIGPPGCGKSSLMRHLSLKYSEATNPLLSNGRTLVPAMVALREFAAQEWNPDAPDNRSVFDRLIHYLSHKYPAADNRIVDRLWDRWLQEGSVLLLLDGLDEIDPVFDTHIKQLLTHDDGSKGSETVGEPTKPTLRCPAIVSCRTISRSRLGDLGDKTIPVYTPAPFSSKEQRLYIDRYKALNNSPYDSDTVQTQLQDQNYSLLASNPQLLSLICLVSHYNVATKRQPLPATRTALYDQAIDILLDRMRRAPVKPVTYPMQVELTDRQKRHVLEELALTMMLGDSDAPGTGTDQKSDSRMFQIAWDRMVEVISKHITDYQGNPLPNEVSFVLAAPLANDLVYNSRVLICDGISDDSSSGHKDRLCRFLHATVQEYLAACALARRAATVGFDAVSPGGVAAIKEWETDNGPNKAHWNRAFATIDRAFLEADYDRATADVALAGAKKVRPKDHPDLLSFIALLDHKAWLPDLEVMFLFLAGKLNDPVPLLDLLSYKERDDMFRHRLALAAMCMAEIDPEMRNAGKDPPAGEAAA